MDALELKRSVQYGKKGGKKTLATYGKAHFIKAANARWKKHRAAKKLHGIKKS